MSQYVANKNVFSERLKLSLPTAALVLPLELCNSGGAQKATGWSRKFDDMCIRLDSVPQRDGLRDRNGKTQPDLGASIC